MSFMVTPPEVEQKYPLVNFPTIVYPRVVPAVLEMKVRDVIFSIQEQGETVSAGQSREPTLSQPGMQ